MEDRPGRRRRLRGHGHPLPEATLKLAKEADAMLFGAVGDWKYDKLERPLRPEQAILGLRKHLGLFANFRPAICYELTGASSLKPELVAGLDILIIRELTGDIYFGQPRGAAPRWTGTSPAPKRLRHHALLAPGIERIAHVAFQAARKRGKAVTSVDKANVLETFQFWKDVVTECTRSTRTSSWTTCTWTTPPCSWSRRPRSST
jgi:3-isopropylmalate dehydrogenase